MSLLQQNYFALFGLDAQYVIDQTALAAAYQQLQRQYHPDRFVNADPQQQRLSLQIATLANEAYQTLKHDTARARYLLQLQGIDTLDESNTAMPADFLMLQMEWREQLMEASQQGDRHSLMDLREQVQKLAQSSKQALAEQLTQGHYTAAAELVRQLSFIDKIQSDIQAHASQ